MAETKTDGIVKAKASANVLGREVGLTKLSTAAIARVAARYLATCFAGNLKGTLLLASFTL
jgi:hypothetical protein